MSSSSWNGSTGDWTDSTQWSDGVPVSGTDATISAAGSYTVTIATADDVAANTVTLDAAGGTLDLFGTLATSSLAVEAGTLDIDGTLQNAMVALDGGTVDFGQDAIASFSSVTWTGGSLDLGTGSAQLLVTNGLTVQGTAGAPGTIDLDGSFSNVDILDAETLSAVTIDVGSATGDDEFSADGTLTLAATTTVDLSGAGFTAIDGLGTVINAGTILAAATAGIISPAEFTNAGLLEVTSGGTLAVQPGDSFTNTGSILVAAGGTLTLQPGNAFDNTGTITVATGAFLELATMSTLEGGGTLNLFGTADGSDQVLAIGTAGAFGSLDIDGTLQNATIALDGGTVSFGQDAIASFSSVTWTGGSLDLGSGSAQLLVTGGLTVQGTAGAPGTIDLDGSFSNVDILDAETLSAVTITVGSATGDDEFSADGTLTLAASTTVDLSGAGFTAIDGLGTVINAGTILAAATAGIISPAEFINAGLLEVTIGGTLAVQPGDSFTNTGSILVAAGGTLTLQPGNAFDNTGTITVAAGAFLELATTSTFEGGGTLNLFGTADGSDQVLAIGTAGAFGSLDIDGALQNATIALDGGTVSFGQDAIASFSSVTWTGGLLDLGTGSAQLLVTGGLTVQGTAGAPGIIDLDGSFSNVDIQDAETLSAVTIDVGSATGDDEFSADGTLTLAATTTVDLSGAGFTAIDGLGTVINAGTILAAATAGIISPAEFTNAGLLEVTSGGTLAVQPGDSFTNTGSILVAAGGTLTLQPGNAFDNTGTITVATGAFLELATMSTLEGGGTLNLFGTADGSDQVLAIGTAGAFGSLDIDGTLQNATIALGGGTVSFGQDAIASFSSVTWTGGSLDLGTGSAQLLVTNGLVVQGTAGAPGTIDLDGSFSNVDILDAETLSAVTITVGSATGDDEFSADGTLTLAASTTVDLSGAGFTALDGLGTVINAGTILAAAGFIEPAAFINTGSILVTAGGSLAIQPATAFDNEGTLTDLGSLTIGVAMSGAGTIELAGGARLDLTMGASGGTVGFAAAGDTLLVDSGTFAGTLAGFDSAGTLDLTGLTFAAGATAAVSGTTLTLTDGATTESFALASVPADTNFFVYADANGGTEISTVPCYCPGTLIRTVTGDRPIETLVIGDELVTHAGAVRPIRWIGRRSYTGRFAARNPDVLPILIHAGALADGVPQRDLMVSPLHALFLDGMLIPAATLVNGRSIEVVRDVERVEYIHLELDSHDVILAEGAPAESFVDDDSRGIFQNAAEFHSAYPDAPRRPARFCAPRVEDGEALEAVRRRLDARAVATRVRRMALSRLDVVTPQRIEGWARDAEAGDAPVWLRIRANGVVIGEVLADRFRPDLVAAGMGAGRHAFQFVMLGSLAPEQRHEIRVERITDRAELNGSPWIIEARAAPSGGPSVEAGATSRGRLDVATRTRISGWAFDTARPDQPVAVQILDNGVPIARVLANRYRPDLGREGVGCGRHAFEFTVPGGFAPLVRHVVSARFERDGRELPGSPLVIEAADSFDNGLREAIARAIDAVADQQAQDRVLSFMAGQVDRLLQQRADADAHRAERGARSTAPAERGLRALVIDLHVPVATRDAGSVAMLSHMQALQRLGYEVSFVAADTRADEADLPAKAALEAAGIRVWGAPGYGSVEEVLRRQSGCFELVYLHRAAVATRYLALARSHQARARVIYSVADLHHVRLARQAAAEDRPELLTASQQMRMVELSAARSADAVITHSTEEAALLSRALPGVAVHRATWHAPARANGPDFAARSGLLFVGSFAHAPNVDAAHWLVQTVMKLVWRVDPTITCRLIGVAMPASVRALAQPGVEVIGAVGDLGAELDRVRLTVAAMRFGAGVKGKVVESFAAGVPCVMSPVAAEGLALSKTLQRLVGRDAAALASLICRMHAEPAAHQAAARAGLALVRRQFSKAAVDAALAEAVAERRQSVRAMK